MTGEDRQGAPLVILGVAESDAHAVANRLIEMYLRAQGYLVVNLGVCTPLTDFADALAAHPEAVAVLIGSLNGHAYDDLRDLPALRAAGWLDRPVVVGGNLSVDGAEGHAGLHALGVDHVARDEHELLALLDQLCSPVARSLGEGR
ncbi:cobalamin-dependent protein [Amycolatopsis aidingensis]|uniref:cobalamin-dependent protein n=1 Tax=Amycolatopsis aidingensis TaxID=2842453 RepID=UPI001E2DBB48|nr:cobalamin-dependent protein [Amycolatopsis aidingensis]